MIIKPQGEQILIEKYELTKKKKSEIIRLDAQKEEEERDEMPFLVGKVLSVGQLCKYAKVGDMILYERFVPIKFKYEGKDYQIFLEKFITAWLIDEERVIA